MLAAGVGLSMCLMPDLGEPVSASSTDWDRCGVTVSFGSKPQAGAASNHGGLGLGRGSCCWGGGSLQIFRRHEDLCVRNSRECLCIASVCL